MTERTLPETINQHRLQQNETIKLIDTPHSIASQPGTDQRALPPTHTRTHTHRASILITHTAMFSTVKPSWERM